MLRVGLTGGIACGKSHVLRRLAAAGLPTLDLDRVAHEVMAPGGPAHAGVVGAFGPQVLAADGSIDRKRLGAIVFADAEALARLNALVHPRVREEEERRVAALAGDPGGMLVVDAALLVETGVHLRFDRLVVVHCPAEMQLRRLQERDGLDAASARARIESQMPIEEKTRYGHLLVDSSGSYADTDAAVAGLLPELNGLAREPPKPIRLPLERAAGAFVQGPQIGPRGLTPAGVLQLLAQRGGLELEVLAGELDPPARGPWYRAALPDAAAPGPETLAAPLTLWALGRRGSDAAFLSGAAASVARLTHGHGARVANACYLALALQAAAAGTPAEPAAHAGWLALAARWGGAAPSPPLVESVRAAAGGSVTPPGSPAGALAGLLRGVSPDAVPAWIAAGLGRLGC